MNLENGVPQYVEDEIGNKFKMWSRGSRYFISAPTGSGKSHFVLYKLLPYVISNGGCILYLVNRKVLKNQLLMELYNQVPSELFKEYNCIIPVNPHITIQTYQYLEEILLEGKKEWLEKALERYSHVVYDECHYFYADSNFNTNTELSFDFLVKTFDMRIQIFMSATMENVKECIQKRKPCYYKSCGEDEPARQTPSFSIDYTIPADYSYVNLKGFKKKEEIAQIIKSEENREEKWLVFVDDKKVGQNLMEKLIEKDEKGVFFFKENEVIFIDADYDKDSETQKSVNELNRKKLISQKIIITTPVLDNGISFHDIDLKNIVILTDTKEEFIQMLGRKRINNEKITVYVCERDSAHFKHRLQGVEDALTTYQRYAFSINWLYVYPFTVEEPKEVPENGEESNTSKENNESDALKRNSITLGERIYPYMKTGNRYCFCDTMSQQQILSDILRYRRLYETLKKFTYVVRGQIAFNTFSIERLYKLKEFYKNIIEQMETDEYAFLKLQAEWLGLSEDAINNVVTDTQNADNKRCTDRIQAELEELLGEKDSIKIDTNGNKALKNIRFDMRYFLEKVEMDDEDKKDKMVKDIAKKGRTTSSEKFNYCMEKAKLPYTMSKDGRSTFIITRTKNEPAPTEDQTGTENEPAPEENPK